MILVVGDAMIDRYYYGEVERISPEAPVPIVKMLREEERAGAAANVRANCEAMGAKCSSLYGRGPNIVKIRVIGKNQQVVRIDFEYPQTQIPLLDFERMLPGVSVVVFSDYGKGSFTKFSLPLMVSSAKEAGAKVLIDPKGYDYRKYRGADVVKPNLHEMKELVGGWSSEDELESKAHQLRAGAEIGAVLLTKAEEGMTLYTKTGSLQIKSEAREVYDVSGAGDTAIAALAVAMEMGMPVERAAIYANKAAGIAVGRFGTAVITKAELEEAMREAA